MFERIHTSDLGELEKIRPIVLNGKRTYRVHETEKQQKTVSYSINLFGLIPFTSTD